MNKSNIKPIWIYYLALGTVILTWGLDPIINSYFYKFFSASLLCSICTFASAVMFIILSFKDLKKINIDYIKIAVPICTLNALANLFQRIGLQYTTPANYAFLEYLSVAVVPFALLVMTGKKPTFIQLIASFICICGCFVFSGASLSGFDIGIGEILCALAGVLGGICVSATGVYVKKLDVKLYITIYMCIYFLTSLCMTVGLNNIKRDGVPLEKIKFVLNPSIIIILLFFGLFSVGICWLLRTEALKHISPAKVVILNPFSAIITGVVSIIIGYDNISVRFVVGGILILVAALISSSEKLLKK